MICRIHPTFSITMCKSEVSRFREPKTVEEVILLHKIVPPSTKYKNKWATSFFYKWQTGRTVQVPVLDSGEVFLLFNESGIAQNVDVVGVSSSCSFANCSLKVKVNYLK